LIKKENRITAVIVEPGKQPRLTNVDNELESFQKLVGGYIEVVRLDNGIDAVINEEGKLIELEPNIALLHNGEVYDYIAGTAVLVSHDDEGEFVSLTPEQIDGLTLALIGDRI
jgi:hypothetical protein